MSYTRLNPKSEWKTAADGKVNYLIYGKIAIISVYWTGFTFNGNWQDVAQLDGIVPADSNYGYYICNTVSGPAGVNVWTTLTTTGMLRVRNATSSGTGILGTFAVALA